VYPGQSPAELTTIHSRHPPVCQEQIHGLGVMGEHFKRFKTIGGFEHCIAVVSENPAGKLTNLALVLGN
jgi:hypothetical protein